MIQLSNQLKPKVVKKPANPRHDYEKKLDYDLHQRKVLVITGIRSKVKGLKPVIDKHHGLFRGLDASAEEKVSSSKLKREIRDDGLCDCLHRCNSPSD